MVPCRPHFRDVVIPTLYKDAKIKVEESLQQEGRVAVKTDVGTLISTDSYVTVFIAVVYLATDCHLKIFCSRYPQKKNLELKNVIFSVWSLHVSPRVTIGTLTK